MTNALADSFEKEPGTLVCGKARQYFRFEV